MPSSRGFWRGLTAAVVPMPGGARAGVELVNGFTTTAGAVTLVGEANGPAINSQGAGLQITTTASLRNKMIPTTNPFSCFAFLVRRDSSATIQAICGNGYLGNNGWTFQLNYAAGELGLTRWGIADNKTVSLGAVPNTGGQASCVGLTLDGTTARFMLNGRFESVASGIVNAPTSTGAGWLFMTNANGAQAIVNTSFHVIYVWNRVLVDSEMLRLYMDPWAPLRPRSPLAMMLAGRGRSFVPSFIG